jgi:TonB family protein
MKRRSNVLLGDTMPQRNLLWIPVFLCALLMLVGGPSRARNNDQLQSFYVAIHYFSDYLPDCYEEILDVTPQGQDVRVRVVRFSSATEFCGGTLLRAVERVLPNTSVRKVAGGIDLCSYTEQDVATALEAAAPKVAEATWDSAALDIVAKCGTKERVFEFPYPAEADLKALHRDNPRVDALWDLTYEVRRRVLGKKFYFHNLPPAQEKESRARGTKLLPELVSGKYDAGFGDYTCGGRKCDTNYLAWRLKGYTEPPMTRDPSSVELVNASSLRLLKYEPPRYPPIAKAARLSGEVRLAIVPDPQTGLVKDVHLVSGNKLLGDAAIGAAKSWQFSPGTESDSPVEAVLEFSLCPNEK